MTPPPRHLPLASLGALLGLVLLDLRCDENLGPEARSGEWWHSVDAWQWHTQFAVAAIGLGAVCAAAVSLTRSRYRLVTVRMALAAAAFGARAAFLAPLRGALGIRGLGSRSFYDPVRNLFGRRGGGEGSGPDFSHVDSREKAEQLVSRGELARLHLVPPDFGGTDDPRNVVYVPPFAVALKQRTEANVIAPLAREGRVRSYTATPHYEGASFVPVSIEIRAFDPGDFASSLRMWGQTLEEG